MVWALLFCLVLMGTALEIQTRQPWLGVDLKWQEEGGAAVTRVYPGSPASGKLSADDVILALVDGQGTRFPLTAVDLQDDHSDLPTFELHRHAMQRQGAIARLLKGDRVGLLLADDRILTLEPSSSRPLSTIPSGFWIMAAVGTASFLIGFTTWRLRSSSVATRIFFTCGLGITICAWASMIFVFRELALSRALLVSVSKLSVFGAELTAFSCVALIWSYPKPIARYPVVPLIYTFVAADACRVFLELADVPGHSFIAGMVLAVPLGFVFSVIQWRNAAGKPDERAVLKWVNLSIYIAVILVMALYFLPIVVLGSPVVGITFAFIIMLFVFLGFAFAITRYRLFDIERWWSDIWLWFFAGLTILVVDLLLVLFTNISQGLALTSTLFVVGWIYFPFRQRLWGKIFRQRTIQLEDYLPKIAAALTGMSGDVNLLWRGLLQDIFQPLAIEVSADACPAPAILDDGLVLAVPGARGEKGLQLRLADRGRRLFQQGDASLCAALFDLVFGKRDSIASYMEGARAERQRIVRDLHDEVAGKLLAMKLIATEARYADLADDALKALRSVIYSLDKPWNISLQAACVRWREDMRGRCEASGIKLRLSLQEGLETLMLTPRELLNFERIVHEGVTNAVVHSCATEVAIDFRSRDNELVLELSNDGNSGDKSLHLGHGRGLLNIAQRMSEMGGRMEYLDDREGGMFHLYCIKPLETGDAEDTDR